MGVITATILIPLVGMIAILCVPERFTKAIKWLSVLFTGGAFLASLSALSQFDGQTFRFQMLESVPLFSDWGLAYRGALDGISIWLFVLTTLLTLLSTIF